jgi:predicted O-linked N-acetylglucosamine transferase (SPINDLY family)
MAPIQCTYLGYPNSTGLKTVDYRIVDVHTDPPGLTEKISSEKLIRLPETMWCFTPMTQVDLDPVPPNEKNGYITFGTANYLPKLNDTHLRRWAKLLTKMPTARMIIKSLTLNDMPTCEQYLRRLVSIDFPIKQVTLCGGRNHEDHLRTYNQIDIGLDPYPYHGTTTTCEALWMGVPVVTLAGRSHVSRVGASLLRTVGLPDLVAENEEEYLDKAFALASDPARIREIRSSLRQRMESSVLMDPKKFVPQLEEAFEEMLRRKEHPLARKAKKSSL